MIKFACLILLYLNAGSDSDVVKLYDLTSLCDKVSSTVMVTILVCKCSLNLSTIAVDVII